jgi:hypothetical protein
MNHLNARFLKVLTVVVVLLVAGSGLLQARDWAKDPPWVEIPHARRVVVVADVHGALPQFVNTLEALKIARRVDAAGTNMAWTAGTTILVFTGDYGDRGEFTREVYDLVMSLESQAQKAGGRVIPLLGNHEVLLLNGQVETWAKTLTSHKKQHYQNTLDSFTKAGHDFHQAISPQGKYGAWIRRRPLFAVINGYLLVHGGLPKPHKTRSDLAADFRDDLEAENWKKGIFMHESGPLWHRDWWKDSAFVEQGLKTLGVRGIIFGHTIGAIGAKGAISHQDGRLVSIDVGMTPAYGDSQGGGLLMTIDPVGDRLVFRAIYPDRPEQILFQVPAPVSPGANSSDPERSRAVGGQGGR